MPEAGSERRLLKKRSMSGGMLLMTVFCCVSGGPFGLEPLIGETGSGFALLLILLIPILWALPDSLTTAELAPAIPVEGGYIVWVRRAMGPFMGFLNAWWSWMYSLLDAAIYPVLFSTYLWTLLEQFGISYQGTQSVIARWLTSIAVIAVFATLNIRGTRLVGRTSSIFAWVIIVPFALMVGIGLVRLGIEPRPVIREFLLPDTTLLQALAGGLAIVLWNYLGWDSLSTIAEEVEEPQKAYPRAIFFGLALVTAVYALPTIVGLAFFPDATKWEEGVWPTIAGLVGGRWLEALVHVAALVSPIALFTAALLASSRIPFVLAEEGYLPKQLQQVHPRFGTPWKAVLVCSVVYGIFAFQSFEDLVELNVIMYCCALVLESLSLIILRYKEPDLPRPFSIPGGLPVLLLVFALPVSLAGLLVYAMIQEARENPDQTIVRIQFAVVTFLILSGPVYYGIRRLLEKRQ
jgi:amino acid transporter